MRTPLSFFWQTVIVWLGVGYGVCFADTLTVFSADWCHNCVRFKKDIGDATELEKTPLDYVDFDEHRRRTRREGVKAIPTFILYDKDGAEVARKVGYSTMPELADWLKKHKK